MTKENLAVEILEQGNDLEVQTESGISCCWTMYTFLEAFW